MAKQEKSNKEFSYSIIEEPTLEEFILKVRLFMELGYKPQGGVTTGVKRNSTYYIQAVVLERD